MQNSHPRIARKGNGLRNVISLGIITVAFFLMLSFQLAGNSAEYSTHGIWNFYNSDVVHPFLLIEDIVGDLTALADWYYPPALYVFPDWLLAATVMASRAPSGWLPLLYGALLMALYSVAGGAILAVGHNVRFLHMTWVVAAVLFLAGWTVALFSEAPVSPWPYVNLAQPFTHSGAVLATLLGVAIYLSLLGGRYGWWPTLGMAVFVFAATVSDFSFLAWFVAPACFVAVIYSWSHREYSGVRLAAVIAGGALAAWTLEQTLPSYEARAGYLGDPATIIDSLLALWSTLKLIAVEDKPLLLISVCILALWVRGAAILISLLRRRKIARGESMELLLGGICGAAIVIPLITGIFKKPDDLYYAKIVFLAPPIWLAYHAARNISTERLAWTSAIIVLFSCAAIARPAYNTIQRLVAARPLQVCLEAENRTTGIGDYWTAKLLMFMSDRRIHIVQVGRRNGESHRWIYNEQWFTKRADNGKLARPDFIVATRLKTSAKRFLRLKFGTPQRVLTCDGEKIWLYKEPLVAWTASCPKGKRITLKKPYPPNRGFAYIAHVTGLEQISDSIGRPRRSPVVLCEMGHILGPPHTVHEEIRQLGQGRFSHWSTYIVFSSSDNSDPNSNGREYLVILPGEQ